MKHLKQPCKTAVAALLIAGTLATPAAAAESRISLDCGNWRCELLQYIFNRGCSNTKPEKPEIPEETPDVPVVPETPEETPDVPVIPEAPEETPDVPEVPETPDETPEIPEETPDVPNTPDVPEEVPESPSIPDTDTGSVSALERRVVELVNEERAAYGLSPLTLSVTLSDGARLKSQDMRDNRYFDHNSPTYGTPFEMMQSLGISYAAAAENIAMGYSTAEAVVTGWMNSAGHRANILSDKYTHIGVGHVDGYWTQWFTR